MVYIITLGNTIDGFFIASAFNLLIINVLIASNVMVWSGCLEIFNKSASFSTPSLKSLLLTKIEKINQLKNNFSYLW